VGTNIGAGQHERALSIALTGGVFAFVVTEIIGIMAAIWPEQWLMLFSAEPDMIAVGTAYLRTVGPFYGFFGLGLALYFASQGGRPDVLANLKWPYPAYCCAWRRMVWASSYRYKQRYLYRISNRDSLIQCNHRNRSAFWRMVQIAIILGAYSIRTQIWGNHSELELRINNSNSITQCIHD
jgi:hypothetical protein